VTGLQHEDQRFRSQARVPLAPGSLDAGPLTRPHPGPPRRKRWARTSRSRSALPALSVSSRWAGGPGRARPRLVPPAPVAPAAPDAHHRHRPLTAGTSSA